MFHMWRWQQSGRNRLWRHIIAGCSLAHGFILCLLFLVYRGSVENYLIYTSSTLTTQNVILLPLHKVVGNKQTLSTPSITAPVASAIDAHNNLVERQLPKERESSFAKATADRAKATTLTSAPKNKKAKNKKKKSPKKSKKAIHKKNKHKKEKPQKTKEQPKQEKKIEEKKEEKIVEQPVGAADNQIAMSVAADAQSAVYVGQLEYEALQLQEAMQRELQTHWKPPVGHAGLTCIVRVIFDWQGAITDTVVEQSSGVLMFDMSAEQAINAMTFPKTAWGKQVTITFS